MNHYRITLLKGDGIGPEIVEEAVKVLDRAGQQYDFTLEYTEALLGGAAIDQTGSPLPERTVQECLASDAVLLGAVGGPKWDGASGAQRPEAGLLGIRSALSLFANLRPAKIFGPLAGASPLRPGIVGDSLDVLVVRELTGASAGIPARARRNLPLIPNGIRWGKSSASRGWPSRPRGDAKNT